MADKCMTLLAYLIPMVFIFRSPLNWVSVPATVHTLRHSFETHLLDCGTNLRYIQKLLGFSFSKTTEIYTHVSANNLTNITNPFEMLPK